MSVYVLLLYVKKLYDSILISALDWGELTVFMFYFYIEIFFFYSILISALAPVEHHI